MRRGVGAGLCLVTAMVGVVLLMALALGRLSGAVEPAVYRVVARQPGELVLDAGHGGEDGGAVSVTGVPESQINLEIVLRMRDVLGLYGVDPVLLREVQNELKKLKPNDNPYPPDTRASYTLRYKDGTEEKICMGEYAHFWFRGRNYTNNRLLYLLRKSIGYYGIVWEPMIDGLEELNDTTFEREPVVGKHGLVY